MGTQPYRPAGTEATGVRSQPSGRNIYLTLIMLVLCALFIRAGFWQLDRAAQKTEMQNAFARAADEAMLLSLVDSSAESHMRFRRFSLTGTYDSERQILLENIVAQGQNGYQVLTPFRVGEVTVLVNRGWVKAAADRSVLPDIGVPENRRTLVARLNKLPAAGIKLAADPDGSTGWPRRMLYPDQQAIANALQTEVPDYQLLLEADQQDGYQRDWQAVGTGPLKNYGYAVQWFAFAGLTIIFYIITLLRWKKMARNTDTKGKPDNE